RYTWADADCEPRSAALVRNDAADPGGGRGGFMRELTWRRGPGDDVTARGTGASGWQGWGYIVNHYAATADVSRFHTGTYRTVLAGPHHAIHEFKVRMQPGGPVDATVHWFFASGRTHPVYFIRYDATPAGMNVVNADSRAPYGDLAFEGTAGPIGGIAWGDKYKFTSMGNGPLGIMSAWDYTQPNVVPYVRMWSQGSDAEMGAVQTETWESKPAGGDYGGGMLAAHCWGKTSANRGAMCVSGSGWTMPTDWLWPFQLNQYELMFANGSHRLAWGTTYGGVGKPSYQAFGKTLSGYPTLAYSVFMTVGKKTTQTTLEQVTAVERMLAAQVTASVGGPVTYEPSYAVWAVPMAGGKATVTLNPAGGEVKTPVFRFTGFSGAAPAQVTLDGAAVSSFFATVDAATQTLWLTLHGTVTGRTTLHVE
ncbi:MAG: hypothetical protein JNK82_05465, partial [Myxococcaceae bacterium]|nr:hypothetical protein [Myxococcaceae bacterium]